MKKKVSKAKRVKANFVADMDEFAMEIEKIIGMVLLGYPEADRSIVRKRLYELCIVGRQEDEGAFLDRWGAKSRAAISAQKTTKGMSELSCMLMQIPVWRTVILVLLTSYDPGNPEHVACVDAVLKEGPAVDSVKKAICHSILLRRRS